MANAELIQAQLERYSEVPQQLKDEPCWVAARLVADPAKPGKFKKVPVSVKTGSGEGWNLRENLGTFSEAITFCASHPDHILGFAFEYSSYLGIDIDDAFASDGNTKLAVDPFLREFCLGHYLERSPSGNGLRAFIKRAGTVPANVKERAAYSLYGGCKVEIFSGGYCTITGAVEENATNKIKELDPIDVYAFCEARAQADKAADDAGGRNSALAQYAGKLANKGLTYQECKELVMARNAQAAEPLSSSDLEATVLSSLKRWMRDRHDEPSVKQRQLVIVRGDQRKPQKREWLWDKYLPLGELIGSFGNSSQGKSPAWLDLAARISRGASWPDGSENARGPKSVVLFNAEDHFETKILPRYLACGGDPVKLHYVKGSVEKNTDSLREDLAALDQDIQALSELITSLADVGIVIIDPVTNHLGRAKYTDHQQVRSVLTPLAQLAHDRNFCAVVIGHFNRAEKGTLAQHRTLGAGFYHVCRMMYIVGPDPEANPDVPADKYKHVMTEDRDREVGYRFHTEKISYTSDGDELSVVKVVWDEPVEVDSEAIVDSESRQEQGENHRLANELVKLLRDGERAASLCISELVNQFPEIKDKSVKWDRVRKLAKVNTRKNGKSNVWFVKKTSSDMF